MSIRQTLAEKPAIGALVAVLVLVAAVGWIVMSTARRPVVAQSYYWDLEANKLFVDTVSKSTPFQTSEGHTAVTAAVFACGECGAPETRFVGYLQKYSDELLRAQAAGGPIEPDVAKQGHVVRSPTGEEWIPSSTPRAIPILEEAQKRCGTQKLVACIP